MDSVALDRPNIRLQVQSREEVKLLGETRDGKVSPMCTELRPRDLAFGTWQANQHFHIMHVFNSSSPTPIQDF
jgi:hypothetical protein